MELLSQTACCRVEYDADAQLLAFTPIGFLPTDDFRTAYNNVLTVLGARPVQRWLSDYGQMRAVRHADQDWLVQNWAPRFTARVGGTLRRSAVVISQDAMNQLFSNDVTDRTQELRHWEVRFFNDRPAALGWLRHPLLPDPAPASGAALMHEGSLV